MPVLPERILAWPWNGKDYAGQWHVQGQGETVCFVREDSHEAAVAAARAEAYRKGWRFAFRQCERTGSVPDPDYKPVEAAP